MTVKTRLVVSTVLVLALALTGLVTAVTVLTTNQAREDGLRYARSLTAAEVETIGSDLTRQMATAQLLARTLGAMVGTAQGNRALADAVERDLLAADRSLLGVWSAFEPGAFDGRDAQFVGQPATDAAGRYISYWFRDGAAISVTPLVDYETPGAGDYYLLPRNSGTTSLSSPTATRWPASRFS